MGQSIANDQIHLKYISICNLTTTESVDKFYQNKLKITLIRWVLSQTVSLSFFLNHFCFHFGRKQILSKLLRFATYL